MVEMKQATVELSEYDPEWPQKFHVEKDLLMKTIGHWNFGGVEHVGSTAVPGLIAKPVVDIMFGVRSLEESKPTISLLADIGYVYSPYKQHLMHWFCKPSDAFRTHHLHLISYQSPLWKERVCFRDLLRSNKQIASAYAALKTDLAVKYKDDRESYTSNKWPFIQQQLERAADC